MKSGAYLVIADAYLYKAANPPSGIRKAGEPYRSWDWLKESLGADFELVAEPKDVWQPLRQSKRLYHSRLLQVSVWRKKH